MPSFSQWYSQQYAAWNRTRRLRASPYLARTETNTSRRATALATAANAPDVEANLAEHSKEKKQETLFGPNIGIVSDGPAWAHSQDATKSASSDFLTPDIVRRWVETSKETIQPTTTLQALVNLKRPTLRLSPLETQTSDDTSGGAEPQDNHALEFEYDCDAPKCSINVQVIVLCNEPNPPGNASVSTRHITVYESVFEGGFGRSLKLEDGATVDLGRFEHIAAHGAQAVDVEPKVEPDLITTSQTTELPEVASQPNTTSAPTSDHQDNARKRRFTALHFRRRSQNHSVSGPALAVVDNDVAATTECGERERDIVSEDGVRIVIQLVALDDFGKELSSVNRQSTYLHVVRLGSPVVGEDHRSWVVKVVKREATIGPHTFHLHEIYGLSSASTQPTVPAVNPNAHTYPPTTPAPAEDEPSSECLVCLSSPREVILLPCRHLVACKECAINMVEFGAGGAIMHSEEPTTVSDTQPTGTAETPVIDDFGPPAIERRPAEGDSPPPVAVPENEEGNAESSAIDPSQAATQSAREEDPVASSASAPAPGPATLVPPNPIEPPTAPAPQNPRRKRRAKGWSCPVCRQPYTSLLRITTTPPQMDGGKEGKRFSTSTVDHPLTNSVHVTSVAATGPTPALESTPEEPAAPALAPSRSLRPSFFRGLSRRAADPVSPV